MSRPSEKCSHSVHEALKHNDAAWSVLAQIGIQEDYDDAGNRADLELRNCACGSTIARRAK